MYPQVLQAGDYQACQLGKPKKEENYSLMPTPEPPTTMSMQ